MRWDGNREGKCFVFETKPQMSITSFLLFRLGIEDLSLDLNLMVGLSDLTSHTLRELREIVDLGRQTVETRDLLMAKPRA